MLGVEFRKPQHAFHGSFQLAELLVHGDGFNGEALRGIGIANTLEALRGLVALSQARVKVTDGIQNGEVFRIMLQDFFVLGDGILQLTLLNELLRSAENFLFIETETNSNFRCL